MATRAPPSHEEFLASLRARHRARAPDPAYEELMYRARMPPDSASLKRVGLFLAHENRSAHAPPASDPGAFAALDNLLASMQWPEAAPVEIAARILPAWDTLPITTLLHTAIPDYALWGPEESAGLARLGQPLPYVPEAARATQPYGRYLAAIKTLREEARFDQVPESHHYLTRIVQAALADLGRAGGTR